MILVHWARRRRHPILNDFFLLREKGELRLHSIPSPGIENGETE